VEVGEIFQKLGMTGAAYAVPVAGGRGIGFHEDDLVTPASVMKIQVALTVENAIVAGSIDGGARRVMRSEGRTPGPVGISLMRDDVSMSVRDLVSAMLTVSDNVATDELIATVGLDEVNRTTQELGLARTQITSDLRSMLDEIAGEVGFRDYSSMALHDPAVDGLPSNDDVRSAIATSAALNPARRTHTTARETAALLRSIWTDRAGAPEACAAVRQTMAQQLTRHRIASVFLPPITVAAKSGGLMGIVRNEAGVVTFPSTSAYAVAVFTRSEPGTTNAAEIDSGIGTIARLLIDRLRDEPVRDQKSGRYT
jgi:beta-lactamase class A